MSLIIIKQGDIFEEDVKALVNPVNCEGVMGAGLAKKFALKFRGLEEAYQDAVRHSGYSFKGGNLHTYIGEYHECIWEDGFGSTLLDVRTRGRLIFNLATKERWKDSSSLRYVAQGVWNLRNRMKELSIRSVAIPALGCGLGGLWWGDVLPIIKAEMSLLPDDVKVVIFEPV